MKADNYQPYFFKYIPRTSWLSMNSHNICGQYFITI